MNIERVVALVICAAILVCTLVYLIINQRKKIIEWLKYAVTEAEKILGEKTGQLKLRKVYDWYVEKFPVIAGIIPFTVFSAWVDIAIETMEIWLDSNVQVKAYVEGKTQEVLNEGIHKE